MGAKWVKALRQQAIIISSSCSVMCNLVYCLASRQVQKVAFLMSRDRWVMGMGAKLPESPATIALLGQKSLLINVWLLKRLS
jgi:hypothetical protein